MNSFKSILKVFLPALICATIIWATNMSIEYYPLSFGLVIGLANWDQHKNKLLLGILLSVLISYVSFFIGYFSFLLVDKMLYFLGEDVSNLISLIISPYIIAPLLVFLLYKFVFVIPKTKITAIIIISSIIFLILQSLLNYSFNSSFDIFNHKILNPYTVWQIIMALGLQLIINQKVEKNS